MKVAVTGATGFIGRHVLAELESRSVEAVALLRPGSGGYPWTSRCRVVAFDLNSVPPNSFDLLGRPDILIHLAWSGLPNYYSLHHFEQELPKQYLFLKGLIESGLKTVVIAGTCFEYGMRSGQLNENIAPQPILPYGFAKNALRCQLEYLKRSHPFQLTWARLFYLFGEGQAKSSLFPQIKEAAERGNKFFNMSCGEQLRDYLPVDEAARHLVSLALAKRDNGIVNICSGIPISVRRLVEEWIKENRWTIQPNLGHYMYPDYEPMAFWGERKKLTSLLDAIK